MGKTSDKTIGRQRRHRRLRKKIAGTAERPRLAVYRSLNHIYAQVIDDDRGHTLTAAGTNQGDVAAGLARLSTVEAARAVGKAVGERALALGITSVVFDRGGYPFHGRVKALADAAREVGLDF